MTNFEFPIRENIKRAWKLFTKHAVYFLLLAVVMLVLSIASDTKHFTPVLPLLAGILTLFWSYVSVSSALAAVDGKDQTLSFDMLKVHFPTMKSFLVLLGVIIVGGIIILGGLIILIIPGLYFMIRLSFAQFAVIDRKESVKASLRTSWHMVKGDIFWTVVLGILVVLLFAMLTAVFTPVISLLTYPMSILFLALLYRAVLAHHMQEIAVAPQAEELAPAPQPTPEPQQ